MPLDLKFWLLTFIAFIPIYAFALPEDSREKIYIVADTTEYNYKTGTTIYTGNVKVDQGTTHITADKLKTKTSAQHTIQEAIAFGEDHTAHYWTVPKKGDAEIHANAKIIKFYPVDSNIILEKEVVVTQGENSFHGERILYNRNDQTVLVPASDKGRAVIVYNPDAK